MQGSELEKFYLFVERLVDSEARQVIQALYEEGGELSEADIAEKTGLKLNAVRRALNLLAEKGLVVYRRQRHPEKNRLVFYWRINYEGLPAIIEARRRAALERLRTLLEGEEGTYYYVCPNDGTKYTFEEALEHEFTCPRCGTMLVPDPDRELRIQILRQYVSLLEAEVNSARRR
ncbi:transcription factor [Pyrodictium occultum]|uniref:Transcription factor E n=1 Tax=Pyrodictium occultum TaxID=2309 RepID=A0A0V8RVU0_PYROC|nr:GntR family transcriptional regulator [Pyrodictium occultum]KSW12136.1 transcription factor [Pyrodictium occultum]